MRSDLLFVFLSGADFAAWKLQENHTYQTFWFFNVLQSTPPKKTTTVDYCDF